MTARIGKVTVLQTASGVREGKDSEQLTHASPPGLQASLQENSGSAVSDDPVLARMVRVWRRLPAPIRAAIRALVDTSVGAE